jgi:hypothetical protein
LSSCVNSILFGNLLFFLVVVKEKTGGRTFRFMNAFKSLSWKSLLILNAVRYFIFLYFLLLRNHDG